MKRLVCFFDGTWDGPDGPNVTNVVKLQRATPSTDGAGIQQLTHYEVGIATEYTGRLRFWAGVFSVGLRRRIEGAYRFICEHYQPGDELYIFGFSRGAYEARTLAELIAIVGLASKDAPHRLAQAWSHYRRYRADAEHKKLHAFRQAAYFPVRIKCVGVWETVGTLGIPLLPRNKGANIGELPAIVDVGLHALAVDEPRGPYRPILWSMKAGRARAENQTIEQAWFPGSHVDVGGGSASCALSDTALLWMAQRVNETTGMHVDLEQLRAATVPDPLGEQYLPTTGIYRLSGILPYVRLIKQDPRAVHPLRRLVLRGWRTNRLARGEVAINESVHDSAAARFGHSVPVRRGEQLYQRPYRPRSLRAAVVRPNIGSSRQGVVAAAAVERASLPALAGWVLFEWAAQPFYTLIVTFLFGPYFVNVFVGDPIWGQSLWAYCAATAGIIIALGSPIVGAIADVKGRPKWRMAVLVLFFAAAMAMLWFAEPRSAPWMIALVAAAYVVATVCIEFATVLLNGMMPTLVPREQLGRLSGLSWGLAYLGGLLALVLVAGFVTVNPGTGKTLLQLDPILALDASTRESDRLVGPICALWLLLFTLPFFLLTPDRTQSQEGATIKDGLHSFLATVRELPQHSNIMLFLVARMIFIDGLTAIFQFGGIYAASIFGWQAIEQSQFAIILVLAGAIGALLGGVLDDRIGSKAVIIGSLLVLLGGAAGLLSVDKTHVLFQIPVLAKSQGSSMLSSTGEQVFLLFAIGLALVAAPAQASSRSLLARLAPADRVAQFFGLFAFSGKATAFFAPTVIGLATGLLGSQRAGLAMVLVFLAIGLVLMTFVRSRA
jgi:MFS transporter, UMF1 family